MGTQQENGEGGGGDVVKGRKRLRGGTGAGGSRKQRKGTEETGQPAKQMKQRHMEGRGKYKQPERKTEDEFGKLTIRMSSRQRQQEEGERAPVTESLWP